MHPCPATSRGGTCPSPRSRNPRASATPATRTRRRSRSSGATCDPALAAGPRPGWPSELDPPDGGMELRQLQRDLDPQGRAVRCRGRGLRGVRRRHRGPVFRPCRRGQLAGGGGACDALRRCAARDLRASRPEHRVARGKGGPGERDRLGPGEWLRGAARIHGRSHARRDGGGARRRCRARAARLPHRVRCAGVRALLPERDGGSGAEVVRDLRSRARVATQVRPHLRAVLFDWGDTLFHAPHAPEVILSFAARSGVPMSIGLARALWDELWAAGKTPEEIAKGRDLSPEAHRRVWTALFTRADRVVPDLSRELYERVMDPHSWVPYTDTGPTLRAVRDRGLRVGVVSNVPADLRPVFAKHGLEGLVDSFTHSFEVGAEKPDPAIFLAAAKSLG